MRKNSLHFMIDYCAENDLDSTDLQVSEIMDMMDAYGDHVSKHTQELVLKTTKEHFKIKLK